MDGEFLAGIPPPMEVELLFVCLPTWKRHCRSRFNPVGKRGLILCHTHRGSLQVRSSLSINGVNYSPCHQNL